MDAMARIERALNTAIEHALAQAVSYADAPGSPPRLGMALRYAVFPGGARIRPRLSLAVALACGDDHPAVADGAASAIELLHCASLVHDDLPCFDDAPTRRGKLSLHRAFDEPLAVLTGDALIVLAFECLARASVAAPQRLPQLLMIMARGVGMPSGIVAGQAWECEPRASLEQYQRAKTGSLFAAATLAGAAAAGADPEPWRALGERLGEAYQVADDIHDVVSDAKQIGKPTGRDVALGRPSAVQEKGVDGAVQQLKRLVSAAIDAVPACSGAQELRTLVSLECQRFLPSALRRAA